jgi:hypothetical protein
MENVNKHNKFYNGATPWTTPHNVGESVFHAPAKQVEDPLMRSFTGTLEISFSIGSSVDVNVSALIKRFLSYALKTDPKFRIIPFQGGNKSIVYPNGIPTMKEGIELYVQHKMAKYGVRVKSTSI